MVAGMAEQIVSAAKVGQEQSARLRLKAVLENVPVAMDWVTQWARMVGIDHTVLYEIQLAIDEACANVADHAYQGMDSGDMEISCHVQDRLLTIRVRDWGRGFDPDGVQRPDIAAPLEERTLGGLGLFLVRQVMDQVKFVFDPEAGSELSMSKRL
jgi:serine/threonine-protein kinase RsbW